MIGTAKTAGQSAKNLAQQIARQAAHEPLEILKDAGSQVSGFENQEGREDFPQNQNPGDRAKIDGHESELTDKARSARRIEALNQEIKDIHKQDLFKDLQEKISQGADVPVSDYSELSMEEKQVLKAQMEAYKNQNEKIKSDTALKEVPTIHSKPSRRFGAGQREEAERQKTRVEKPVPPSG